MSISHAAFHDIKTPAPANLLTFSQYLITLLNVMSGHIENRPAYTANRACQYMYTIQTIVSSCTGYSASTDVLVYTIEQVIERSCT